jgi:hypothetical protein
VQNPFHLGGESGERGVSVYNIPQVLQLSYVYQLPFGRGKAVGGDMNRVLDAFVGGWQTNAIIRFNDGRPMIPLLVNGGTPIPTYNQRPDLTGVLKRASIRPEDAVINGPFTGTSYFADPNVLSTPALFTFGTSSRTIGTALQPGARNFDMSIFKVFPFSVRREAMRLEFRAEAFNLFNHPQFQGPDATVGASDFGLITSTVNNPREVQLALKLYF